MSNKLYTLVITVLIISFSACINLVSDTSNENPLAQAITDAELLVASAATGVNDGDYYPEDIHAVNTRLGDVKSIQEAASATDSQVNLSVQNLKSAVARAREHRVSHRKDLELMYKGVGDLITDLDYVKEPGRCTTTGVLVYRLNGFTVFNNSSVGKGPVAAGRFGKGRVFFVAAYLNCLFPGTSPSGTYPGHEKMAHNTLKWLTQRSRTVYSETGTPLKVLQEDGIGKGGLSENLYNLEITTVTDLSAEADKFDPARYPVAIVKPAIEDPAIEDLLARYVQEGGSLLMGWPVPRNDLRGYPGQRLLDSAGILWSRKWAWIRGPIPSADQLLPTNFQKVLETAKAAETDWDNRAEYGFQDDSVDYYEKTLSFINPKIIPYESFSEFNAWLYDQYLSLHLSYPVRDVNRKPLTRLLVPAYHNLWELEPGQPPAPGSDYYPGSVDPQAPRVTRSFVYDFNQETFKNRLRVYTISATE